MILDLRTMDEKLTQWIDVEDLDADDRKSLEVIRDLVTDVITRPS
jgi:hypothetical protein